MIFHYIVLLIAFIKWRQTESFTIAYKILFKRLLAFAIVYSIVSLPCIIVRFWELFTEPPLPFIIAHHIALTSRGFGNGIAWYINTNFTSINDNENGLLSESQDHGPHSTIQKMQNNINENNPGNINNEISHKMRKPDHNIQGSLTTNPSSIKSLDDWDPTEGEILKKTQILNTK